MQDVKDVEDEKNEKHVKRMHDGLMMDMFCCVLLGHFALLKHLCLQAILFGDLGAGELKAFGFTCTFTANMPTSNFANVYKASNWCPLTPAINKFWPHTAALAQIVEVVPC